MPGANSRQTWALFCATKVDCRSIELSAQDAAALLDRASAGDITAVVSELVALGGEQKGEAPAVRDARHQALWDRAIRAGAEAGDACVPTPMIVAEHANMLDDSSPIVKAYHVPSGVCGFAGVNVIPGNSSFARWAVKHAGFRKAYRGGVTWNVSAYGQSYDQKTAFAQAAAEVLRQAGLKAYVDARLD